MSEKEFNFHGITEDTVKNMMLGAGTIHKNLKFDKSTKNWNFAASLIGATQGGNKLSIVPNITPIELDGAWVDVMGFDFKIGEAAKLEVNFVEITSELIKTTVIGQLIENAEVDGYDLIESKSHIEKGDYFENLAFVGKRTDGKPIIIIFDNALCTSGFEGEGKNKENTAVKCVFKCTQSPGGDLTKLPYHIYYPSASASATVSTKAE